MGIVEKFIKEGQLTREEYPELLHLYQDPDSVRLLRAESAVQTRMSAVTALQKKKSLCAVKTGMSWAFGHLCCREEKIHGLMMIEWWTSSSPSDRDIRTVPLHCLLGRNQKKVIRSLKNLKELGYQIGAGFMVGAPGQTMEYLADDLVFLKELNPHMVGIGPFIPHHDTKFAEEPAGSVDLTLFLLSVIRIMLPQVLLPATTALGTLDPRGREKGFQAGANVVMPNLSPVKNRKQYELYDNKILR